MRQILIALTIVPTLAVVLIATLFVPFSRRRLSWPFDSFWRNQRPEEVDEEITTSYLEILDSEEALFRKDLDESLFASETDFEDQGIAIALESVFECINLLCDEYHASPQQIGETLEEGNWRTHSFKVQKFIERISTSEVLATIGAEDALVSRTALKINLNKRKWEKRLDALEFGQEHSGAVNFLCNDAIPGSALCVISNTDADHEKEIHLAADLGMTCKSGVEEMITAKSLRARIHLSGLCSMDQIAFFSEQQSALGRFGSVSSLSDAFGRPGFRIILAAPTDLGLLRFRAAGWDASEAVLTASCNWIDR